MEDYVDINDPINIQFQGIEMRGINDSRGSMRIVPGLEEHEIETSGGQAVRVYIKRGTKSTPLVTFHDVGTNHESFLGFFNYPEMRVLLDYFTVFHICAPGHHSNSGGGGIEGNGPRSSNEPPFEENFQLLASSASDISTVSGELSRQQQQQQHRIHGQQQGQRNSITSGGGGSSTTYPTLQELASDVVSSVVDHFDIKYFLGMGVGAGANVLARYALLCPTRLLGLVLLNPDDTTTGYYHWTHARWSDIPYLRTGVVTDWIQNWLLDHWFGACTERNLDLEQSYLQLLAELSPVAVAGYIDSYMNRAALGIARPLHSLDAVTSTIKTDSFLVSGELAPDLCRAMVDMNGNMDPARTQFISVPDSTGAVMDEVPSKLAVLLLNYLRNLGMLVTVTPDKLSKAALEHQIEQARVLHSDQHCQIRYECGTSAVIPQDTC